MYLVVIAWIYVALMMAVAEATNTTGTLLGAVITFVLYGAAPVTLVVYLMGSPSRRRHIKAREAAERAAHLAAVEAKEPVDAGPPQGDRASPLGGGALHAAQRSEKLGGSRQPDSGSHAAGDTVAPVRKEP
jgi:hypothetical protein